MTTTIIKHRATIGEEGIDFRDLGTFNYRSAAALAIGMEAADQGAVSFVKITPVEEQIEEAEPEPLTDEDRAMFDALITFGRRDGESYDSVTGRTVELMRAMDGDAADEELFGRLIEDGRARHAAARP